jgi:hypothetical protein
MDDSKEQWSMIIGNLTLVQVFYDGRLHRWHMQVIKNPVTIKHVMWALIIYLVVVNKLDLKYLILYVKYTILAW